MPYLFVPYTGALKGYVFLPVFKLFGASTATVRIPATLIGLITVIGTHHVLRRLFDQGTALTASALLAMDPTFIFAVRHDWGPVALMGPMKTAALFFTVRILMRRTVTGSWLPLLLVTLVGLYDKINFLWFAVGLLCAGRFAFRSEC